MLRITDSKNGRAAVLYFDGALSKSDYYAAEVPGKWHGLGAARLGLIGTVERETFTRLIDNIDPRTGARLTARTKADRRPGTDFTFNAPKSVSILHALTDDHRILQAFRQAVVDTMREIEREVRTRVRINGRVETRVTGNIAWAEYLHTTSRPVDGVPDPHLHIHAYVVNATWDKAEQRWKALELGPSKGEGAYYEAAFLARLAGSLRGLGYGIERTAKSFDIAGIPRHLIDRFSRRTAEIEAAAKVLGITRAQSKAELGKRTRQRKSTEMTPEQCIAAWRERAGQNGRMAIEAVSRRSRRGGTAPGEPQITPRAAIDYAVANTFERASVATEKGIYGAALLRGLGEVTPETIKAAAESIDFVRGEIDGRRVVTLRHVLAEEQRLIRFARKGRLTSPPLAPDARLTGGQFTGDQRRAIEHVWRSEDRAMVVRGGAGTGKTTLMQTCVAGITGNGHRVAVFAPTSAARDVLRAEGFANAETLQRLLADERLQAGLSRAVIWVDEAGLISVPDMARLFDLADRAKARIVLSGDPGQHAAVIRGDALRLLERRAGIRPAAVTEIVRQHGTYRQAVEAIATGEVGRGWALLERLGAIREIAGSDRVAALAADYAAETAAGRSVLVVSPTHAEKNRVTDAIRDQLKAQDRIGEERAFTVWTDLNWTVAEKSDPDRYRAGQWVRFTQNAAGITRGARLSVVGRDEAGRVLVSNGKGATITLPLDKGAHFKVYQAAEKCFAVGDLIRITENGRTAGGSFVNGAVHRIAGFDGAGGICLDNHKTLPRDYGAFDHGYASTSVAAQGRTVDTVLVAMGIASLPATFLEQFYVTVSRGRDAIRIYTDDTAAVREAVTRSGQRGSATELVEGVLDRKLKPHREMPRPERLKVFAESLARHMGRVARAESRGHEVQADQFRAARQAAIAEYHGRIAAHGLEIGG